MEKNTFEDLMKTLLIKGINTKYSRVSSHRNDDDLLELIQLLKREPSILDLSGNINHSILEAIFFNYRKEICRYLKNNIRRIEKTKTQVRGK